MIAPRRRLLARVATKSVIAMLPIAMASGYATNLMVETPRLAAYDYEPVAEIIANGTTLGLADSSLYFLTDPTLTIDPVQVAKHLDEMQALGIDNVRVYVPWKYVEPARDQYDWSSMDVIMNLAAQRNMGVLAAVNTTPQWEDPTNQYSPGAAQPEVAEFATFMSALANRYGATVSAYEIWNEPNYQLYYDPISPAAYTALLKAVYPALKTIDPTATVVAAGLGHSPTSGERALSPVEFVQGMYTAGAKGYFDALAYHPYQETTPFSISTPDGYALNQALAMVALMASNGDYITGADGQPVLDANGQPMTKKIWATEYGLATSRVTYQHQAAYIQDFLASWSSQSWAGPAYVYTTVDSAPGSDDPEANYGVYTVDAAGNWVPKPAAYVLASWILAHPNQTYDPAVPTTLAGRSVENYAALLRQNVYHLFVPISPSFTGGTVQAITSWLGSYAVTKPAPASLLAFDSPAPDASGNAAVTATDRGLTSSAKAPRGTTPSVRARSVTAHSSVAPVVTEAVAPASVASESLGSESLGSATPSGTNIAKPSTTTRHTDRSAKATGDGRTGHRPTVKRDNDVTPTDTTNHDDSTTGTGTGTAAGADSSGAAGAGSSSSAE